MATDRLYTKRQLEVFHRARAADWFMLINSGAKRSGKTVIDNDLFLLELIRVRKIADRLKIPEPMYILAGVSVSTVQKNVLQEITNKYGIALKYDKYNNFKLFGVKVIQASTGTIAGVGSIRGVTSFGCYCNEASLANQQVFAELISRCSGEGARIICDTNPDNPEHWLKKEYIDKAATNPSILHFHFTLDDNSFLSERYRENIKAATPSGMFWDRDILGKWVSGEGVVYPDFDASKHYINRADLPSLSTFYCGVDWGYEHHGAIVVIGETQDGTAYILEEHTAQHEEIDYWVAIGKGIQQRYGQRINFWADGSRPDHVARFEREGMRAYFANKAVLSGIEEVAKRWKQDRLFVVAETAKRFRQEIYSYVWNKNTGEPVKTNDDFLDALRYAIISQHQAQTGVKTFKGSL